MWQPSILLHLTSHVDTKLILPAVLIYLTDTAHSSLGILWVFIHATESGLQILHSWWERGGVVNGAVFFWIEKPLSSLGCRAISLEALLGGVERLQSGWLRILWVWVENVGDFLLCGGGCGWMQWPTLQLILGMWSCISLWETHTGISGSSFIC